MRGYKCQSCDAVVRRGSFCSRCGARQAPRILRGALALLGVTAAVTVFVTAYAALGAPAPEFRPPRLSGGTWATAADFGPLDLPADAPSPFGPTSPPDKSKSQP